MNLDCTSNPFFLIPEITCFFINKATTLRNKRQENVQVKVVKKYLPKVNKCHMYYPPQWGAAKLVHYSF
jgi:hypothetical protein